MQATILDLQDELRRAQDRDHAGQPAEALAILEAVADADDPFVPWIWYFLATMAERVGDSGRLLEYSRRFNRSALTQDGDYRVAHVDLLVKRVVHLKRARQDVRDDVATLMGFEPSRDELDLLYSNLVEHVLPWRPWIAADRTVKAPWRRWTEHRKPVAIGGPHYAIDKRPLRVPTPMVHIVRGAQYVTNGRDSGLVRNGFWFRGLGTGPSVQLTLTHLKSVRGSPVKLAGRGLILSDQFNGDNYCHWTMDWVPRALLAQEIGGGFDWLFVRGSRKPFQLRWLEKLGIDPFKVIFEDGLAWYAMDEFVYVDNGNIAVTNPAYGGHPEILQRIRRAAQAGTQAATASAPARRLYISRADSSGRAILNEAELTAMLDRRGFQAVSLSKLSLDEQVALFGSAEIVVGAHGAGLTNIIFLPPGAAVIELLHHRYGTKSYSLSALNADLRYSYLTCAGHEGEAISESAAPPSNPIAFITAPIWVDVDDLARAIDGL